MKDASDAAGAAYAAIAPFYDVYTDHPGYAGWLRRIERIARHHGLRGSRALDVGCGTGKSLEPLLELGYSVVGTEPVPAMLDVAAGKVGARATLVTAEASELPLLGEFDYVSCINDVCNYLLDGDRLSRAFRGIEANLAPGGVLVFDASTPLVYETVFAQTICREADGALFLWRGQTPQPFSEDGYGTATLDVFIPAGELWQRLTSLHLQRHHPERVLTAALASAGLAPVAIYGCDERGVPELPLDPAVHTKAIYVARRLP